MPIHTSSNFDLPEDTILVTLSQEPEMASEINATIKIANDMRNCDIILDMSGIDIITTSSMSKSLKLLKILKNNGKRLILCGLGATTRGFFTVTGLDQHFNFAEDVDQALRFLRGDTYLRDTYLCIYLRQNVDTRTAEKILTSADLFMEELGFKYEADHEPLFATYGSGTVQ